MFQEKCQGEDVCLRLMDSKEVYVVHVKDSEEHVFIRVGKSSWIREKGNGLIVGHLRLHAANKEPAWNRVEEIMSDKLGKSTNKEDPQALKFWRVEKFQVKDWLPEDEKVVKFFKGDSYIILHAEYKKDPQGRLRKEAVDYDIHFWIGKTSTQDEYGTAAYKTVELDSKLGDEAVQHREVEGCESDDFKEYFKKMGVKFETIEGGIASGFRHVEIGAVEKAVTVVHYKPSAQKKDQFQEIFMEYERKNLCCNDGFLIIFCHDRYYKLKGKNVPLAFNEQPIINAIKAFQETKYPKAFTAETFDSQEELEKSDIYKKSPQFIVKLIRVTGTEKKEFGFKVEGEFNDLQDFVDDAKKLDRDDVFLIETDGRLFVWIGKDASSKEKQNAMSYAQKYLDTLAQNKMSGITVYKDECGKCPPFVKSLKNKRGAEKRGNKGRL
ncbi:unnamed protein product [Porites evermanni]|uniref:Gelsolin-like domain-containing protein n=1 Tax=Porites evermanni TaxID=104178 RepID=A0ABN8QPM3_9CNID|nr:unnamed protein product [Porites evermanni]